MKIDTQIDYNVVRDVGSMTITVSEISMEAIKSIIDAVRNATVDDVEYMRRRVLEQAQTFSSGGSYKINLIKAYRSLSGEGLREAKDWVEANFDVENF